MLEYRDHRPVRGGHRQQVEHDRGRRDHDRAERGQHQDERDPQDEHEDRHDAVPQLVVEVDRARKVAADERLAARDLPDGGRHDRVVQRGERML
jgi:hypothetical protein